MDSHGRRLLAVAFSGSPAIVTATLRVTGLLPLFDTAVPLDDTGAPSRNPTFP